ncbi:sure-like protein [Panus rudis PR-1116 ss-1]|nr:sure-like protein [Panus rudis PR-1116 ss-1]
MLVAALSLLRLISILLTTGVAQKIVLTNDDSWATNYIRAQFEALDAAGFQVVLSAPALDKSMSGAMTAHPKILTQESRLNWVNAFPVDAVSVGIETVMPRMFGGLPDFVVSGPNIGNVMGSIAPSGTVGAACEAVLEGIPAIAVSGGLTRGLTFGYTTLDDPDLQLTTNLVKALVAGRIRPLLRPNISINVNYGNVLDTDCLNVSNWKWVATRLIPAPTITDLQPPCLLLHMPAEATVQATAGCWATVSVIDARTKLDESNATEVTAVLDRLFLGGLTFSCQSFT